MFDLVCSDGVAELRKNGLGRTVNYMQFVFNLVSRGSPASLHTRKSELIYSFLEKRRVVDILTRI